MAKKQLIDTQSKTQWAVLIGAGGYILVAIADAFQGNITTTAAIEQVWHSVVAGLGVLGVRGWFKQ